MHSFICGGTIYKIFEVLKDLESSNQIFNTVEKKLQSQEQKEKENEVEDEEEEGQKETSY